RFSRDWSSDVCSSDLGDDLVRGHLSGLPRAHQTPESLLIHNTVLGLGQPHDVCTDVLPPINSFGAGSDCGDKPLKIFSEIPAQGLPLGVANLPRPLPRL